MRKLTPVESESLSYLFVIENLLAQALEQNLNSNDKLSRLNLNLWLNSCFEVLRDMTDIFPELIVKVEIHGETFALKDYKFILLKKEIHIIQQKELKIIRDKIMHGRQEFLKGQKQYNGLSWNLFGNFYDGTTYFIELLEKHAKEMLYFISILKLEIKTALGYDFGEFLKIK